MPARGLGRPVLLPVVSLHNVPPVFQSHTLPLDLCNASQIAIDFMHENFSFLLPIPLVSSLNAETALTYFAYSPSNSPSFQISSQPRFLGCADSEIHTQTWGGDTSFGALKPSSCSGLPGAGALQEMSLEEDNELMP